MIEKLRAFFQTGAGKAIGIGLAVIALLVMASVIWSAIGPSDAEELSTNRMFIDAKTGKPFKHTIKAGETLPVDAPSGGKSGVPAETCFWTKDGQIKKDPTYVLLNENAIPPKKGPTFCPDCGRLVTPMNPPAVAGRKPPPTQAEYKDRKNE
jgi:hypothetical protein